MAVTYAIPGDYNVICDLSGFKCKASETVLQWNGLRVLRRFADERNPQDFVRTRGENVSVRDPRPEQADVFITSPITAADL